MRQNVTPTVYQYRVSKHIDVSGVPKLSLKAKSQKILDQ